MATTFPLLVTFLIVGPLIAGAIILQVFLSKKQSKWLGLILPAVSLVISLLTVLGMAAYFTMTQTTREAVREDGSVIYEAEISGSAVGAASDTAAVVLPVIYTFLLSNIPTLILLGIYFACREKLKRHKEIEKMNIQDLT